MDVNEYVGRTFTAEEVDGLPDCLLEDNDGNQWVTVEGIPCLLGSASEAESYGPFSVKALLDLHEVPEPVPVPEIVEADYISMYKVPVITTKGHGHLDVFLSQEHEGMWQAAFRPSDGSAFMKLRESSDGFEWGASLTAALFPTAKEALAAAWATPEIISLQESEQQ